MRPGMVDLGVREQDDDALVVGMRIKPHGIRIPTQLRHDRLFQIVTK